MIADLRKEFNSKFSDSLYQRMLSELEHRAGCEIEFRVAETPLFLSKQMAVHAATAAENILSKAASAELQAFGVKAIPSQWNVANETDRPLFAAVDFAVTGDRHDPKFKLIELQGFPSLYHYQPVFSEVVRDLYDLPAHSNGLFDPSIGIARYYEYLKQAIVGDCDPSEVALLEIDPHHQKTRPDFYLAASHLGIRIVDIRSVVARGNELFAPDSEERLHRIKRIYNRAIVDELVRKNVELQFDITAAHGVEWAGHPNWYFRISKVLLPKLVGVNDAVPNAVTIDQADIESFDLSSYVLKPLFSFAGLGVNINPTVEDIAVIPKEERSNWLLQEKVEYCSAFETPDGNSVKAELRALCLWLPEWDKPKAMHTLVRLTRGKMVGVDYNKGLDWVGSSCALVV
ncbi:MAG TPA: hypothetical protein VFO76_02130 [Candidatus Kapabacteria bacterium]|nr:hypothetical protein [Candidatus Kapabacteria bacterium]